MSKIKKILIFILMFFFIISFTGCGNESKIEVAESQIVSPSKDIKGEGDIKNITLNGKLKMNVGDTQDLEVKIKPANLENAVIQWSSDNEEVAKVENGKVTALKVGAAKIYAKSKENNDVFGAINIIVGENIVAPQSLSLLINDKSYNNGDVIELTEQDIVTLNFEYTPSENVKEGATILIASGNCVSVKDDTTLECTGFGKAELYVFAMYSDIVLHYNLDIKEKHFVPEIIEISGISQLEANMNYKFKATVSPERALQEVEWSTSDSTLATISEDGVVSTLKAGDVKVIATSKETSSVLKEYNLNIIDALPFDKSKIYVDSSFTNLLEKVKWGDIDCVVGKNAQPTIEAAMEVVSEGGNIYLIKGEYKDKIVINKSCNIIGPNEEVLATSERYEEAKLTKPIEINANNVGLIGLDLEDNASVKVGGNDVSIINCIIHTNPVQCNGNNRCACIVDYDENGTSKYITNLLVQGCYINVIGSDWDYRTNYMSFSKIENLYVYNNFITNEAYQAGTAGEGLMIYYALGKIVLKGNTFKYATHNKLVSLTNQTNGASLVEFSDNVVMGREDYKTAGIVFQKESETCAVKINGNRFYNVTGDTISLGSGTNSNCNVEIKYNYFDYSFAFYMPAKTNMTTFDNNCYRKTIKNGSMGGTDTTTYANLSEYLTAYSTFLGKTVSAIDGEVETPISTEPEIVPITVYVDPNAIEDTTHFKTLYDAYQAVEVNGTIIMSAGTYAENITWNKNVTVVGPNKDILATGSRVDEAIYKMKGDVTTVSAKVSFVGISIIGAGASTNGVYFKSAATATNLEFKNCIISSMKTGIKIESGDNMVITVDGCKVSSIGQFFIWTTSGVDKVKIINSYFDCSSCGAVTNAQAALIRIRSGSLYAYNNYFEGDVTQITGIFENGVSGNQYEIKANTFKNVTKFFYNNGGNSITLDENLYLNSDNSVLTSTPSSALIAGVVKDTTLATSLEDVASRATKYLN